MTPHWRAAYALLTALVLAVTAGCGARAGSSIADQNGNANTIASTGQGGPGKSAATNSPAGMVRLGCGQYCLQAGGYGDAGDTSNMTKILTTRVTALPDGTVAITVKCLVRQPCVGALVLGSGDSSTDSMCQGPAVAGSEEPWWGQSDLDVPAHKTRTFGLTLSPCALGLLSQRRKLKVYVTADSGQTFAGLPSAEQERLTPVEAELITLLAP